MDFINEIEKVLEQYNEKPTKTLTEEIFNLMNKWYVNDSKDYEARKVALEAAVKTLATTGGDLTENAIKYKRFLLNETVNEN